ncbi:response regulator [Nonlabens marinus]|uniref:histidine kinase n=1 Tax=Nonlabens marinus S1-08 TaxID=1454201 RepID=W8VXI1_9FLAO|nr:response regulator [Nonlabens marinus]BAO55967.1 hypothetical protein NMS_1958 [Nonlabens marinus S1-08]
MFKICAVFSFLFLSLIPSSAQETPKTVDPIPEPPFSYAKEEMDSIFRVAEKYYYSGNYEKIIKKVPALVEHANSVNANRAETRLLTILGLSFVKLDDVNSADIMFREALDDALKRQDTFDILSHYINLGNTHFNNDSEKAIDYFLHGTDYLGNIDVSDLALTIIYNDLAELYMTRKEIAKSQYYLDLARPKLYLPSLSSRKNEYLFISYYVQGRLDLLRGDNFKAIESANISLDLLDEGIDIEEKYLIGNYKNLIDAYDLTGQYEKLNEIRKPYDSVRDHRFEKDRIRQAQIARFKFNTDKYQQELKQSQLENELAFQEAQQNRILLWIFSVVSVILIALLGTLLYTRNRRNLLLKNLKIKNGQYLEAKQTSEKLAQKNSKFLSTISHELRTPLYGIIGLSSVFLKNPKLKEFADDFNSLKFSADYLLALVNDVLSINKYESKKGRELKEEHFNIYELATSISQTFQFLNEKNNNRVTLTIRPEVPEVLYGDKTKLSQVIMNLLSNASKFTQDGSIYFTIEHHNSNGELVELLFTVQDTGRGIKEEDQKEIFEEFTQVPTHSYEGGTGLGLPIVNKLLNILGSKLIMESIFGVGTTFSFLLPLGISSTENLETHVDEADVDKLKNKKLLIVDDNKINQLVTQKVLEQYQMLHDTVNNGKEAVDIVEHNDYDYILMDINMPVMNGIKASTIIRDKGITTPILALTAADDLNLEKDIFAHGINSILVKPYQTEQLLHLLLRHLK